mgnify:CR=1 FL=1
MVEAHWEGLRGRELRYRDRTWEFTGDVDILDEGEVLAMSARATDDVGRERARLVFGLTGGGDSLNPGNLGTHFDRIEHTGDGRYVVVRTESDTYRYLLRRLEQG